MCVAKEVIDDASVGDDDDLLAFVEVYNVVHELFDTAKPIIERFALWDPEVRVTLHKSFSIHFGHAFLDLVHRQANKRTRVVREKSFVKFHFKVQFLADVLRCFVRSWATVDCRYFASFQCVRNRHRLQRALSREVCQRRCHMFSMSHNIQPRPPWSKPLCRCRHHPHWTLLPLPPPLHAPRVQLLQFHGPLGLLLGNRSSSRPRNREKKRLSNNKQYYYSPLLLAPSVFVHKTRHFESSLVARVAAARAAEEEAVSARPPPPPPPRAAAPRGAAARLGRGSDAGPEQ
mmetsp:Transcript_3391/g.7582  ORF Transcript_3391/g.7582 Transcript_3391/m.7582 type:complete len:288 (-) Transcript_3391:130-993(-)